MDAAVSGLALAVLCEQVVFNAPERPLYSQQFLREWHFLGKRLLELCGPAENSEFRPRPLRLLIAARWLEEIDPTINRLRFVGEKLIAIAVFASGAQNLPLPRIFPIKELAQLRDDLHKVYKVGTLSIQGRCGQIAPTSWERDAQAELDQFRDLGTVLATFCDAAILRLQGPIPRTQYTGSVHARLDNVLEKYNYAYTTGIQRIMEKGRDTFKEMQKLKEELAKELDKLKQCWYMTQETASARLNERRHTSRSFLNPAARLMPIDPSSFCKDALQELDKKWRQVSSIFDDNTKHQKIIGTFMRCECHDFFVLRI
ncbi:hypothetical protein F5Y08DRAFT_351308 [Xylaria arbuscula]|nr:hypothetical protein F5Y08DRAFT_351308 [Xylaria arbuscula]